jgi:N-methylhydantoinase A/oxoprolinase/acetone carboxylase beta subunit
VLGRLPHQIKLGGEVPLRADLARKAVQSLQPGTPLRPVAEAILRVALAGIERALRVVTYNKGISVVGMPLVPFGGAGGLLACDLAELLETNKVLVPQSPGLLCALGMLHTPASRDLSQTVMLGEGAQTFARASRVAAKLEARALAEMRACGLSGPFAKARSVEARYVGQSFELNVPLTKAWKMAYVETHAHHYQSDLPVLPAEIVNVRVRVSAEARPPASVRGAASAKPTSWCISSSGEKVYARETLPAGHVLQGPAIVTELSGCLYVKRGWWLHATRTGQLLLAKGVADEPQE